MTTAIVRRAPLAPETVGRVPFRVLLVAREQGWSTCDVCRWPVDSAAITPDAPDDKRPARHPSCSCAVCDVPLRDAEPGELTCPQHRAVAPVRHLRVVGGRR